MTLRMGGAASGTPRGLAALLFSARGHAPSPRLWVEVCAVGVGSTHARRFIATGLETRHGSSLGGAYAGNSDRVSCVVSGLGSY